MKKGEKELTIKDEELAMCHIHGKFYAGYCECPTCKALNLHDKEER